MFVHHTSTEQIGAAGATEADGATSLLFRRHWPWIHADRDIANAASDGVSGRPRIWPHRFAFFALAVRRSRQFHSQAHGHRGDIVASASFMLRRALRNGTGNTGHYDDVEWGWCSGEDSGDRGVVGAGRILHGNDVSDRHDL